MTAVEERLKDEHLLEVFLEPVRKCADYKPAFGTGGNAGVTLEQFQDLYGEDLFYSLLGLDSAPVYAAHKAAGGLTSVYRQLGIGCERLVREILAAKFVLSEAELSWEYEYIRSGTTTGIHTLDARLSLTELRPAEEPRVRDWLRKSLTSLGKPSVQVDGAAFEVRQGYKSADSKRQNADLRFGLKAYQERLLPVFAIFSNQVSLPVISRYRADGMLVLTGTARSDPTTSTFAFFHEVVDFDLLGFFQRNSSGLKDEVSGVVETLLSPEQ